MRERERKFWRGEMALLDNLYRTMQEDAQRLVDAYDLKFKDKIRDLKKSEYVRVSEFYPTVREILATLTMNYPRLFFEVQDDEAEGDEVAIEDILERASQDLFEITDAKAHVAQGTLDTLFARVGWIGIDYNPPGDDIIAPWVANNQDAEDLVSFNRRPPFSVHVDPTVPPHMIGHARYIREKLWVPLQYLRDDKTIENRKNIKPTKLQKNGEAGDGFGFGELMFDKASDEETKAKEEAVENGEFVLIDRIHCRTHVPGYEKGDPRRLIMFAPGIDEPIKEVPHPFARRVYSQRMTMGFDELGYQTEVPMTDPETGEPVLDLETKHADGEIGEPGRGYLVPDGFPLIPIKLDMHPTSFYPRAHLEYIEDIQNGIVESMSRKASLLKRWSRQGLVQQAEVDGNDKGQEIVDALRRGEDGEWHVVLDKNNFEVLDFSGTPSGQNDFEDRLRAYGDRIASVRAIQDRGGLTATQAALIGAAAEVNEQWGEAAISAVYCKMARAAFTIMGDPRYTPESFIINVAPDGQKKLSRALTYADFLWNYRITVQAGSVQPMFEQMQQDRSLAFYDRAIQMPELYDARELAKILADIFGYEPDKVLVSEQNAEAIRAAQLENQRIISQLDDPGVLPEQDHQAHGQGHAAYREDPSYQQIMVAAQQLNPMGVPANPQAGMLLQQIDALMAQHMQAHEQAEQQAQANMMSPSRANTGSGQMPQGIVSQVRSNAQETSDAAQVTAAQETAG